MVYRIALFALLLFQSCSEKKLNDGEYDALASYQQNKEKIAVRVEIKEGRVKKLMLPNGQVLTGADLEMQIVEDYNSFELYTSTNEVYAVKVVSLSESKDDIKINTK